VASGKAVTVLFNNPSHIKFLGITFYEKKPIPTPEKALQKILKIEVRLYSISPSN
jgi:hypothetical protein